MNLVDEIKNAKAKAKIKDGGTEMAAQAVDHFVRMLGLREEKIPTGQDMAILVKYVFQRCGESTFAEVKLAIDLYIQGKLDYNKELYDRLSPLFVENVVQSYNRLRISLIGFSHQQDEEETVTLTPHEKDRIIRDGIIQQFERYRSTKKLIEFGNFNYRQLVKREILRMSYSQAKDCLKRAKTQLVVEKQIKSQTFMSMSEMRSMYFEYKGKRKTKEVHAIARDIALKYLYDAIISNGETLSDYLN